MNIPNAITLLRIILSLILIFISPVSAIFILIYIICCISDILDGYIAKKLKLTSDFGAKLDSIADVVFILIVFIKLIPLIKLPQYITFIIVTIFVLRFISIGILYYKYRTFAILHTYLNKSVGVVLFFTPFFMIWGNIEIFSLFVCILAILSCVEELIININSSKLERDKKGLLF